MLDLIKEYAEKRLDLLKMEATEKSSVTAGTITFLAIAAVAGIFFLILFNIGLGLLIIVIGLWYIYEFVLVSPVLIV